MSDDENLLKKPLIEANDKNNKNIFCYYFDAKTFWNVAFFLLIITIGFLIYGFYKDNQSALRIASLHAFFLFFWLAIKPRPPKKIVIDIAKDTIEIFARFPFKDDMTILSHIESANCRVISGTKSSNTILKLLLLDGKEKIYYFEVGNVSYGFSSPAGEEPDKRVVELAAKINTIILEDK